MTVTPGQCYRDLEVALGTWSDIQGHLQFMYETARDYHEPVIIELGVRSGVSTAAFLAAAEHSNGQVWSCDTEQPEVPPAWHENPAWHFIQGNDLHVDVLGAMPDWCDVLFIDTSHDYPQTLSELKAYMPRVKPGGVALLHDTCWEENGLNPNRGVATALDEWCGENGRAWENRAGSYGMGVVHV